MARTMHAIIRDALRRPLPDVPGSLALRQLAAIARELTFGDRGRRFFLSSRAPATYLKTTPWAVHELLKELSGLGVIRRVKTGDPVRGGNATEWEWLGIPDHEPPDDDDDSDTDVPGLGLGLFDRPHARPAHVRSFD